MNCLFWVLGPRPSGFFKRLYFKVKLPITTYRCVACGYLEVCRRAVIIIACRWPAREWHRGTYRVL